MPADADRVQCARSASASGRRRCRARRRRRSGAAGPRLGRARTLEPRLAQPRGHERARSPPPRRRPGRATAGAQPAVSPAASSANRLRSTFLSNLPTDGLRHLVDELDPLRDPPLRDPVGQERAQLVGVEVLALAAAPRTRTAARPTCSSGTAMTAASITFGWPMTAFSSSTEEIHSPPDFTRSFVRSTSLMNAPSATSRDVAGAQPAALELARAASRPRSRRFATHGPRTSSSPPDSSSIVKSTSGTTRPCVARSRKRSSSSSGASASGAADRRERARLGHAPGLDDRHAELVLEAADQRLGHGRAAAHDLLAARRGRAPGRGASCPARSSARRR